MTSAVATGALSARSQANRRLLRSLSRRPSSSEVGEAAPADLTFEQKVARARAAYALTVAVTDHDRRAAAVTAADVLDAEASGSALARPSTPKATPMATPISDGGLTRSTPQPAPSQLLTTGASAPGQELAVEQETPVEKETATGQDQEVEVEEEVATEQETAIETEMGSVCVQCDRCDGKHATSECPYFGKPRDEHPDAWTAYKPAAKAATAKATTGNEADAAKALRRLHGASVLPQPGDGSCLFHSLACGMQRLPGSDSKLTNATTIRAAVVDFIQRHPETECAGSPLSDWIQWESGHEVAAYCARMRQPGMWGGAVELFSFSRLAHVSVLVYERCAGAFEQISAFECVQAPGRPQQLVRVLYSGGCHYDALVAPL